MIIICKHDHIASTPLSRFSLTGKGVDTVLLLKSSNEESADNRSDDCLDFDASLPLNESVERYINRIESASDGKKGDEPVGNGCTQKNKVDGMGLPGREASENGKPQERNLDDGDDDERIFLLPNEFSIILYVDTQEVESRQGDDKIVRYLQRRNINFEVKHLNVGDYLWVCRDVKNNRELVLPYIIERKRMDDLAMSIRDGRFHEQKFRLKQCGIPNVIYLVEKYGNDGCRLGLPLPTVQQAVSNTRIVDGFDIKITSDHEDSMSYLTVMTAFMVKIFKDKTLVSCRKKDLPGLNISDELVPLMVFTDFNRDSEKMRKFTVRNMLLKQLIQLSGLSVEKARAIVNVYPCPKALVEALRGGSGEAVISNLTSGALKRSVGSALAKSICQLYTSPQLN